VTRSLAALTCLVALVALVGCGAAEPSGLGDEVSPPPQRSTTPTPTPSPSGPTSPTAEPRTGTTIIAADSEYGPMLYAADGQPIYLFTAEPGRLPACYDACAEDWPPVLTDGRPLGAKGVRADLLGSTRRSDGLVQVTYAGHPLYHYAHEGPYEVLCHDVEEYGGTWLVVRPGGTAAAT